MNNTSDIGSKQFWISRWEETLSGTPFKVHSGYATPRYWDNAAKDYDRGDDERSRKNLDEILSLFRDQGFLKPGMTALDIGCGTGRISLALARKGLNVTAIDFSKAMIDRLRAKLDTSLNGIVTPLVLDWERANVKELGWLKAFDLVIAHMTPAVRRPQAFLSMLDASRSGCLLKGWAGRRKNSVLEALWKIILGEKMRDRTPDIIYEFNLLYSIGYYPDMRIEEVSFGRDVTIGDAVTHYTDYFSGVVTEEPDTLRDRIREYLVTIAEQGIVHEQTKGRTGMMFWKV